MLKPTVFNGLSELEAKKMSKCLGVKKDKFNTTETIMSYNRKSDLVGIIVSGKAELVTYDYDGNKILLELYEDNSMFSPFFSNFSGIDEPMVVATEKCEVLFFEYKKIFSKSALACEFHKIFLDNFMAVMTLTLRDRATRIEVLTKRNLRSKLLTFFEHQSSENDSLSFTLPFSLYTLADYLGVDRSAMQREMKKLRDEGIINSKGKKIEILKREI